MKLTHYLYITATMLILASCNNKPQSDQNSDNSWNPPTDSNEIIDLGVMERNDTITIRGKKINWSFRFAPVDSLPIIVNPDGSRYHDNDVQLTIRRDSTIILRRRFTKQSFASMVPKGDLNNSALVGFCYNLNHTDDHSCLRFIATVGDPDETSGIYYPIEIRIDPDGSYSLHHVEDFETESPFEGMNEDPSDDIGV